MLDGQHEQNRLSDLGIQVSHAIPYRPCESPAQQTQIKLRPWKKPYQRQRNQSRKTPRAPSSDAALGMVGQDGTALDAPAVRDPGAWTRDRRLTICVAGPPLLSDRSHKPTAVHYLPSLLILATLPSCHLPSKFISSRRRLLPALRVENILGGDGPGACHCREHIWILLRRRQRWRQPVENRSHSHCT